MSNSSEPYLQAGRLSDVLALIQVLAYDKLSYRSEGGLRAEMQREPATGESWVAVASQHPEFFRVRTEDVSKPKVALLSRYVLSKEMTSDGAELKPPLEPTTVNKLMELAIDLHDKQLERRLRWRTVFIPIVAAAAVIVAAILGAGG